jgi:hypothetical protein
MCLYPKLIKNRKYLKNKKNGGIIPPVNDPRVLYVPVGCGKCIECRKQKTRQWQVRLHEEIKHRKNGRFITLTFSNESITELTKEIKGLSGYNLDNEIATLAMRRFLERWRKKYGKSVRHWFVTELGQTKTERLHMHGLLFTDHSTEAIEERWAYGHIWEGEYVNEKTINYIVKYINKIDKLHEEYQSKILTSPGIGKGYLNSPDAEKNKFKGIETKETYKTRTGLKLGLPIYYRNHIFTDEEREKLWLQKLDKEERWILGHKIDVSKGEDNYYKALEAARAKNKRLGFGDNQINWEKRRYENNRRNMLKRVKFGKKE